MRRRRAPCPAERRCPDGLTASTVEVAPAPLAAARVRTRTIPPRSADGRSAVVPRIWISRRAKVRHPSSAVVEPPVAVRRAGNRPPVRRALASAGVDDPAGRTFRRERRASRSAAAVPRRRTPPTVAWRRRVEVARAAVSVAMPRAGSLSPAGVPPTTAPTSPVAGTARATN
ncbi:hypothetical protein Asi02nite_10050 [Asanoa siamensis]|uniref:Uncharacterized protein n=1 Tax=Asanoa siamensis TaxID=926357 RepID=A0ABQ4CJM0_9ACTN|nr:hypothetical protein Asi02nite_10050 [Asanoa siamensis]